MWRKAVSLAMAAAVILSLGACSGKSFYEALGEAVGDKGGASEPEGEGYFPDNVWRADVDYREMEYERYDLERFREFTAPIYELAENGGTEKEYAAADDAIYDELYYIYTLYTLISNEYYANAANEELAREADRAQRTYFDARGEFYLALRTMAESENARLLETYYTPAMIDYFKSYEPSTDEEDGLTARENELISRYYALIAGEEPDTEAIGELYVELVELRKRMAETAGYGSFAEYAYESFYIKDYTPEDAQSVWQGAKECFAPLAREYAGDILERSAALSGEGGLEADTASVLAALGIGARELGDEVYEAYRYLTDYHLYDLDYSEKKADEGYTCFLHYYNEPFIFNSPSGTFYDFPDTFHEFGHFVSFYYYPAALLYSAPDNDLSELHAQGMSVVMTYFYDGMFDPETADAIRDQVLLELIYSVVEGSLYDEFQQRVFAEPELTAERVNEIYAGLCSEYGYAPYEGYETEWMWVTHNFTSPFYYISYAVSALGALEINELCREDLEAGIDRYLTVLAMDPEVRYYSEAIAEAGLSDIFDRDSYSAIAGALALTLETQPEGAAA